MSVRVLKDPLRRKRRFRAGATAAVAVTASLAVAAPAAAASTHHSASRVHHRTVGQAGHSSDPAILITAGGDRTSATPADNANFTGGTVTGLSGVEFRVTGSGLSAAGETCTTGGTGQCTVNVPGGGSYTVERIGTPGGWYARDSFGVGSVSPLAVAPAPYNPVTTVTVPMTATTVNVPLQAANNPYTTPGTATATARTGVFALSRNNPQLPLRCGLRFGLLFDLSASITPDFLADMKNAATKFVEALRGTPSYVSLYTFGTTASPGAGGNSPSGEIETTPAGVSTLISRIRDMSLVATPAQYTNWDAGIYQMTTAAPSLDEAIVLTDGDPTAYGPSGTFRAGTGVHTRFREVENGVFAANRLKALGTKVFAVGLDENRTGSIQNLTSISGTAQGQDYYETTFGDLADLLPEQALENCAGITITKKAEPSTYTEVGQAIHYTYTVTNTGSHFTLDPVTVSDDHIHDPNAVVCEQTSLAPGRSTTCHATYRITQEDLDRGYVTNTATATGTTDNGTDVTSDPADATVHGPQLEIEKSADPDHFTAAGQSIIYTYRVTNNGTEPLRDVVVTDDKLGLICTIPELAAGESQSCTALHITTQADVEAGFIHNAAFAKGEDEATGEEVHSPEENPEAEVTVTGPPVVPVTG